MKDFPAVINSFLVWLQKSDVKGKYQFYHRTKKLLGERYIVHSGKSHFAVPYDQWCFWKTFGPEGYYLEEMLPFCQLLENELEDFVFFDLGADVGVVANLVSIHCPALTQIFAFEPNPKSFELLKLNSEMSKLPFRAEHQAVSSFEGKVKFSFDSTVASDHEGHIKVEESGNTPVTSLDFFVANNEIALPKELVIKIDVEGQELEVIKGAKRIISASEKTIILLEIHPDTLERDNLSPEAIFEELEKIREVKWHVPLLNKNIDRSKNFFDQFPLQQYDVIAIAED